MQNPRDKVIITCAVTGNQTLPSMTPRNRLAPGEKVRSPVPLRGGAHALASSFRRANVTPSSRVSFGRQWIARKCPASSVENRNLQGLKRGVIVGFRTNRDTGKHPRHSFAL